MQNNIVNAIFDRNSYRGKYENSPVPREDLQLILEAGLAAPSGCNMQTTSLVAVDDEEVLSEVKAVISPKIAQTAPAIICVLSEKIYAYRDKCFSVQDYSAAIQNMLVTIKALGYESCWYEGHVTDDDYIGGKIANVLGLDDKYRLVCILPVGKATDKLVKREKKSFEERAWFNKK